MADKTNWLITATPERPSHLSIQLTVHTTAAVVVEAVEDACADHGIVLEPLLPQDEAEVVPIDA